MFRCKNSLVVLLLTCKNCFRMVLLRCGWCWNNITQMYKWCLDATVQRLAGIRIILLRCIKNAGTSLFDRGNDVWMTLLGDVNVVQM